MLALDTQAQDRWRQKEKRESFQERRQHDLLHNLKSNTITVEPDGGRDVSDLLAQMGRPLTSQQVIDKLKLCNPRLIFRRSVTFPDRYYDIRITTKEASPTGGLVDKETQVCGMEAGIMPEFSVLHKKKIKVANPEFFKSRKAEVPWLEVDTFADETRGWRTVLVRLLHNKLITEADVQKHFGWAPTRESKKWHDQTT